MHDTEAVRCLVSNSPQLDIPESQVAVEKEAEGTHPFPWKVEGAVEAKGCLLASLEVAEGGLACFLVVKVAVRTES